MYTKRTIINILWVLVFVGSIYAFVSQNVVKDVSVRKSPLATLDSAPVVSEIKTDVNTPNPIVASTTRISSQSVFSSAKIIALSNNERIKEGLPSLGENALLNKAARAKVNDMFSNKYFAHISPDGISAADFVKKEGYSFLVVGENLASGGFTNEQDIVDAWMASIGHRENILNKKYREIGVATATGKFEGKTTLFAVQIFGTPSSVCPQPDSNLKAQIDLANKSIEDKKQNIDFLYGAIGSLPVNSLSDEKISEYNSLVKQYNDMIAKVRENIDVYNSQVNASNECISRI